MGKERTRINRGRHRSAKSLDGYTRPDGMPSSEQIRATSALNSPTSPSSRATFALRAATSPRETSLPAFISATGAYSIGLPLSR
jgi:hypothetical protein